MLAPVLAHAGRGTMLYIANDDEERDGDRAPYEKHWVAARGATRFTIRVRVTASHSSLADQPGVRNALADAVFAAERLTATPAVRRGVHPTYRPWGILIPVKGEGTDGWGVALTDTALSFNLRVTPGVEFADLREQIALAIACAPDASDACIEDIFADEGLAWTAPSEVDHDDLVVTAASTVWTAVLGSKPTLGYSPRGTDAKGLFKLGMPTIRRIGPSALARAHRPDEYVTVPYLVSAARLYARLAREFLLRSR